MLSREINIKFIELFLAFDFYYLLIQRLYERAHLIDWSEKWTSLFVPVNYAMIEDSLVR